MTESTTSKSNSQIDAPDAYRFGCMIARVVADSRCVRTHLLDVRGISPLTDFLVITTGTSDRQMGGVATEVKQLGKECGWDLYGHGGEETGRWIVADFVGVVLHLFDEPSREYYDLESLWSDGKRVDWAALTEPGEFSKPSPKSPSA
jgi:ribosome-associated protein